jgi:hypothetical protein
MLMGCAGFATKPFSFSNEKADLMAQYCQSGKQIKSFKTTVLYFTPKIEPGLSLDKANQKMKETEGHKTDRLKNLFYLLANEDGKEQVSNMGDEPSWYLLTSEDEKDVLDNVKAEDSNTKFRLFTFIVRTSNKIIIYHSNLKSRRMNYAETYSTDLNNLISNYTLLAPKDVAEQITATEFDSKYLYGTIILNESGEIDISEAIEQRNRLWKAYINKFTSIKETSDQNSQKSTIELSLDLNVFCKYGRSISTLQSQ